ncbi:MAG: hypothetical protein PF489_08380 [Salinivirgaceae bacterium]|nr:hypothetical protein [Salinivirgaceae bacterium]
MWCLILAQAAQAVPAWPHLMNYKLPDGTTIELTIKGDEKIRWAETKDGYSLLLNKEGFYEYAKLNENGDMVRSGIRAYNSNERTQEQMSFVSKLNKKVHFSPSQVNLMHQI